ncbi:hypothetical protein OV079_26550 [Nannocystis pusilla]|uniref:Peptidase M56 domain-containing protein n=1 Tax=Nannocystis pusilla TaxID=889268 RepID=A0A9X3IY19_9BACT|nr:M56 family metallopeptidase [Nannocystis pusilla]MCY1009057.1 hypothetical protein [Nannocystis pusilla]
MFDPAVHTVVSWLGTYFVHSSVLIGGTWAFTRFLPLDSLTRSLLWKMSLVGGLFTATLQTGLGVEPLLGSVHVEAGSLAPGEPPLAPDTAIAPPPPQVVEVAAPVMMPELHGCVGCEPQVVMISDAGVTAVFAAPANVRIDHAAFVTSAAMIEPAMSGAPTSAPPMMAPMVPSAPPLAPGAPPAGESQAGWTAWLFAGLFGLGAAASLGRLGVTAMRLRRGLRGRTPLRQGPLRERLLRLMAHVRVPQDSVRLTMSERVGSPMALASREIVVPARAHGLAPRQQEAMLAHELAHVLRRDPAWQVLASVLEAALFFQPLNRVARRGMQEAAEELCDDWAVRHTGSGLHLARCLTEVAQWPGGSDMAGKFASPMAGKSSLLVRRVERLLDARERERGRWARRWRGLLGAALLAMVGLGAPGLSLSIARAEVPEPPVPPDPELMPEPVFASATPEPATVLGVAPPTAPTTALGAWTTPPGAWTTPPGAWTTPPAPTMLGVAPTPPTPPEAVADPRTAKQRRAQRQAERHERKATELREQGRPGSSVQVFVPQVNYVVPSPSLRVPGPPHAVGPVPPTPPTPPMPPSPPAFRIAVEHDHDDDDDDSCSDEHGGSHRRVVVVPRVSEKLVREGGKLAVQAKVIDARQLRDLERAAAAIAKQASKLDAAKIEELKRRAEALARRAPELSPQQLAELAGRAEKIAAEVERKVEHLDLAGLTDALEHLDVDNIADEVEREVSRSLRASADERGRAQAEQQREQRRLEREHRRVVEDARQIQREAQREAQSEARRAERERLQIEAEGRRTQAEGRRAEAEARRAGEEAKRVQKARARAGEAVRREVERALRDGVIDAEEQRRIEAATRKAGE